LLINLFHHEANLAPIRRLVSAYPELSKILRPVLYRDVYRKLSVPVGTCIFSDLEFLTPLQLEAAACMEQTIRSDSNYARILNSPTRTCERFQLLRLLRKKKLSTVEAVRLDSLETPKRYPVFLRSEQGCFGPETGLLNDATEFEVALQRLVEQGRPLKGRISLSYEAEPDQNGIFRKYGANRIGDRIVPQHIMFSKHWMIKAAGNYIDETTIAEELNYVRTNPHNDFLLEAFDAGGIEYGRADYGFKDGKPVIYEININPTLTGRKRPAMQKSERNQRLERRNIVWENISSALHQLDDGEKNRGWIDFYPNTSSRYNHEFSSWEFLQKALWRMRYSTLKRQSQSLNGR